MTDRDALRDRLDAVEETLADTSTGWGGTTIVYTDGDGYVTPDGDPVPTDADGNPDPPDADRYGPTIVLDGRYDPRNAADARGDT
jgi:hypothetical protein